MANAHVHVGAPQQHLLAPVLGAGDDFLIAGFIRKRILAEIREWMPTGCPDIYTQLIGGFFHRVQGIFQVSDCFRNGVANACN